MEMKLVAGVPTIVAGTAITVVGIQAGGVTIQNGKARHLVTVGDELPGLFEWRLTNIPTTGPFVAVIRRGR